MPQERGPLVILMGIWLAAIMALLLWLWLTVIYTRIEIG